jgi:hypothetical protein
MPIRRAFFVWQFAAAAVLPLWVLLGYALWGGGVGGLLGIALLAPLIVVTQLGLAVLFTARASVRRSRALDWPATGALALFSAAVVGLGFFGPSAAWFGVLAVAAALGGFWLATVELVREVRARMRATLASLGYPPQPAPKPLDAGEYVVIKPSPR